MQAIERGTHGAPGHTTGRRGRRRSPRATAVTVVAALSLGVTTTALAATAVTVMNPGGITAVGPVNAENGFPSWYEDKNHTRVELCLNADDPMCGFLPGDIPDETQPISFPDNFPEEAFYMLAGSTIDLPGGGRATLTLGLEAAFANTVTQGDQVVFARQRIFVKGGPANTTMTFKHPYGTITIDTDAGGDGRITEDISPATGNFQTPLKGNIGPFLSWGSDAPAGYLGDPAVEHTVTGGPLGNTFEASWPGAAPIVQDLFTVQGKKATNTGVTVDAAVANGNFLDVFATSEADPGELYVAAAGDVPSTPMQADPLAAPAAGTAGPSPHSFYARIDMTGKKMPATVTVRNIGDSPISSGQVDVTTPSSIVITDASYDGKTQTLHVAASSPSGAGLTVSGYGTSLTGGAADITTAAPPAEVRVTDGTDTATAPVRVIAGDATPPGLPPITAAPDPGPVCEIDGVIVACPVGGPDTNATPTARIAAVTASVTRGDTLALDGSGSSNATSYKWTQLSGTPLTITGDTTAKPTIKPDFVVPNSTAWPLTWPGVPTNSPAVIQLVASNGSTPSQPVTVSVPIAPDTVQVTSGRFRSGTEIRIDGTSRLPDGRLVLTPQTTVAVYVSGGTQDGKLIGTSPVDTTGAWSVRLRSTTGFVAFTAVKVVSSRGGSATFTGVSTR